MDRIILHIDVNNAFLSWSAVWMLKNGYNKDIRNRYAVIGGDESQRRGIVLAKSGLCKKRGVKTADPIYLARRKCPYLEVYPPKFEVYKKFSDMMYKYLYLKYGTLTEQIKYLLIPRVNEVIIKEYEVYTNTRKPSILNI